MKSLFEENWTSGDGLGHATDVWKSRATILVLFAASVMILPMTDDLVPCHGGDLWVSFFWHSASMVTMLPRMRSDRDDRRLVQSVLGREQAVIESSNAGSLAGLPRGKIGGVHGEVAA